jgi:hypothetical protein
MHHLLKKRARERAAEVEEVEEVGVAEKHPAV